MKETGYSAPVNPNQDDLRLEAVTVCVHFDDILDVVLQRNHPHVDTMIVVTSHDDKLTHAVCKKHGATCVKTDLFRKNGRNFNKGAAINAGFGYFQYRGWRLHLDADILLPDNFRRILFNHTHLDRHAIYGADRVNVVGMKGLEDLEKRGPQHHERCLVGAHVATGYGHRYVDTLEGYLPIGFFQLWHAWCQKPYPYSRGDASHDDTLFSALWPQDQRFLLPNVVCYHLCERKPIWSENWDGKRRIPRLKR